MKRVALLTLALLLIITAATLTPKLSTAGSQFANGHKAVSIGALASMLEAVRPTACAFGFCDDCMEEADAVYYDWIETTSSGCTALKKSAEFCYQNCPTCSACETRINTAKITCGIPLNEDLPYDPPPAIPAPTPAASPQRH